MCVCVCLCEIPLYFKISMSISAHFGYQYVDVEMKIGFIRTTLKGKVKPLNGVSSRNIPWVKKLVKSYILFCCHQRWKDGVEIEAFMRCTLQPNLSSKCHFAPNALSDSQLAGGLVKRAAVGGVFVGRLTKVTNLVHCRIIWDCNIQREPPATLKPSKPKLYLVCTTKLEPGFFYKLS